MSEQKTIIVSGREFKPGRISPVEMLTLASASMSLYKLTDTGTYELDFSNKKSVDAIETFYTMVFEHVEVKLGEKWYHVKEKDADVWWPEDLQNDYSGMMEIIQWFISSVIFPVFTKSRE